MLEESGFTISLENSFCKRLFFPRLKVEKPSHIEPHVMKMLMMSNVPPIFVFIKDIEDFKMDCYQTES